MSYTVAPGYTVTNLDLARVGYDNALARADTLESLRVLDDSDNEDPAYPVVNVVRANTYETYRPTTFSPKIKATWPEPQRVNYLAIARHNIASAGITECELWATPDGGSLTKIIDFLPESDAPFLIPFAPIDIVEAQVRFGTGASLIAAVVHVGEAIVMERPLRASMQPVWASRQSRVVTQTSDGGEILGSILVRKGNAVSPNWTQLSRDFYNLQIKAMAEALPTSAFFFAWQPDEHPDEVLYGALDGDVTADHIARSDRYTFAFNMTGGAL